MKEVKPTLALVREIARPELLWTIVTLRITSSFSLPLNEICLPRFRVSRAQTTDDSDDASLGAQPTPYIYALTLCNSVVGGATTCGEIISEAQMMNMGDHAGV